MRIQCDYTTTFMAKPKNMPSKPSIKKFLENKDKFCSTDLYTDIDNYLNNNITKTDFLKKFANKKLPKNLNRVEQKHINDLKMTIDLTNKLDDISDEYVKEKITKLLKTKKV